MANKEQLAILKSGVKAWNEWRNVNIREEIDLNGADLGKANLAKVDLWGAKLREANLRETNLQEADLHGADLRGANLELGLITKTDLSLAYLNGANLEVTDLTEANLTDVKMQQARLLSTKVRKADFLGAIFGGTTVADVDLSTAVNLETIQHVGPSTIGIDTIYKSGGNISENFLRGAGVPENFIEYKGSLTGKAFEYYSCFISYSSRDQEIAERLHEGLQAKGIRVWFAPEDLKIGDKLHASIDQAIREYDKLMIILSENSIRSAWVRREVSRALEKEEKNPGKTVLFPIRLDGAVFDCTEQWADDLRQDRNIGDFSRWKNHDCYQQAFGRLVRDLQA